MKKQVLFLACLCGVLDAMAQDLTWFTPSIVRVQKSAPTPKANPIPEYVVTAKPAAVKVKKQTSGDITTYTSSQLIVKVNSATKQVTFTDLKGNVLLEEANMSFTPIASGIDKGNYRVRQSWNLDADEAIYGLGLTQNGRMSQRGEKRLMMQSNLDDYSNVFHSVKGYGIYWSNYSPTEVDLVSGMSLESQVGTEVDYYFMYGGDADGVIKNMRYLTGKSPMLPLWTYGFHQSRERYKSQEELLEVVDTYRKRNIPLDGIIQDWQYWGSNYTWNAMEFLNENFQGAQRMIDDVHNKYNAHMSISIWASFGPHTKQYKELADKGLLMNYETWPQSGLPMWPPHMDYPSGVKVYNPYSTEARDIYWKYLSKMNDMKIDAWWMDSTDPDHHSYKDSDLDEEVTINGIHEESGKSVRGSYRSVRNIFPLATVEGVYDHQRAVDDSKRVFILTRSFFAGQQRTGANTWSGDIGSSWDALRKQIPNTLNHTLAANPQVNNDLGGFFCGSYNTLGPNSSIKNPQYQELYVRWMQFGAFMPMMRSHGADSYRELYLFGNAGEPVYDALVDAVKLRYKFLPYIYSTSWQVSKNDDSFMRALVMDFKNDKKVWDMNTEYMFGRSILVVPVLRPFYTKEKVLRINEMSGWDKQKVDEGGRRSYPAVDWSVKHDYEAYLPAGATWYDYWTGARLEGGQTVKANIPLGHSPLYVKAGSILPVGPDVQYAAEKAWDNLELVVYPGANAEFTLYEDEGDGYNYEKGIYTEIPITWNDKARTLTIGKRIGSYPGMLTSRQFRVRTHDGSIKTVNYSGAKVSVRL